MPRYDNLYVQNLPFAATDDDLKVVFDAYGVTESCSVMQDFERGRSVAFVKFRNAADARKAQAGLNGKKPDLFRPLMTGDGLSVQFSDSAEDKLVKAQERMMGNVDETPAYKAKRLQRESPEFRQAWNSYCKQHQKPLDPLRHDAVFLAQIMAACLPAIRKPTIHYSLMIDDSIDVNSKKKLKEQKKMRKEQKRWQPPPGALTKQAAQEAVEAAKRQRDAGRQDKASKRKKCPVCGDRIPLFANFCGRGHKQPENEDDAFAAQAAANAAAAGAAAGSPAAAAISAKATQRLGVTAAAAPAAAPTPVASSALRITAADTTAAAAPVAAAPKTAIPAITGPVGTAGAGAAAATADRAAEMGYPAPPSKRARTDGDSSDSEDERKRNNRPTVGARVQLSGKGFDPAGALHPGDEGVVVRDMWQERGVPEYAVKTSRGTTIYEEDQIVVIAHADGSVPAGADDSDDEHPDMAEA